MAGVDVAAIGLKEPERDTDEHIVFSEPRKGVYKSVIVRLVPSSGAVFSDGHEQAGAGVGADDHHKSDVAPVHLS